MLKIKVIRRTNDFHASVEGRPGLWDCGNTASEAIGELLLSHPREFGVDIETTWKPYELKDDEKC